MSHDKAGPKELALRAQREEKAGRSKAFNKIEAGLKDALAIARRAASPKQKAKR